MNTDLTTIVKYILKVASCSLRLKDQRIQPKTKMVSPDIHRVQYFSFLAHTGEYTDYDPFGCPFPVLANMTDDVKPVGCSILCNNGTEKLDDNTPCYVIEQKVHHKMSPLVRYGNCPLGVCTEGICKPQNKAEDCYKGKEEQ
ncbi:hypothetical protein V5799_021295 [Amblyomma americanum]|uniref:Evasin n=1 Tax=Amblyomma americanum TaxID=6943 RepID=A0AAQ4FPD2_AMBAM